MHQCNQHRCVYLGLGFLRWRALPAGVFCGLGWLFSIAGAVAAEQALAPASPFLSDSNGAPDTGSTMVAPLELRGLMSTPQGLKFAIHDPSRKYGSTWIGLNEVGPGFVVREYRIVNGEDRVTVDYQGRQLILMLRKARIAADTQHRQSQGPSQSPTGIDPSLNQNLSGIPISDMLPGEKGRLEMLVIQVRNRLARQKQPKPSPNQPEPPPVRP